MRTCRRWWFARGRRVWSRRDDRASTLGVAAEAPFVHAYDDDFDQLIAEEGIAVVDFWAPWCEALFEMVGLVAKPVLERELGELVG